MIRVIMMKKTLCIILLILLVLVLAFTVSSTFPEQKDLAPTDEMLENKSNDKQNGVQVDS